MAEDLSDPASDIYVDAGFQKPARPTKAEVYAAVVEAEGNKSKAARELKTTRRIVSDICDATPEIVALLSDFRDGLIDHSEDNIFADVKKGDQGASRFVLGTIGAERGWAQGVKGSGKNGAITVEITTFSEAKDEQTT